MINYIYIYLIYLFNKFWIAQLVLATVVVSLNKSNPSIHQSINQPNKKYLNFKNTKSELLKIVLQ